MNKSDIICICVFSSYFIMMIAFLTWVYQQVRKTERKKNGRT